MSKQQNTRLSFAQSRKFIAILFLMFFAMQFGSPLALITTPVAHAECGPGGCSSGGASAAGGLGSLLTGGGGSMLEMIGMIMGLLMQLFQGGSTPQQGTAEEKPGQWASGQERFSSGLQNPSSNTNGTNNVVNVYNPATIPSTSLVLGSGVTLPGSVQLKRGGAMTISNSNTTPANIEIRNTAGNTTATTTTINSGDTKVFRFSSVGSYQLCTGGTSTCGTTIVVAN